MKFVIPKNITSYSISLIDMDIAYENVVRGEEECVFIVEHEGIYSAGKSFEDSDFTNSCEYAIYYTKRGGRVTIHNVGQVVVYPILNLKKRNLNVSKYVSMLETWMITVLKAFEINASLSDEGIGVWANGGKIGFAGIRIEKGISTHGICLNVNNNLSPFENIIPCGIKGVSITSMKKILNHTVDINEVKKKFCETFDIIFETSNKNE